MGRYRHLIGPELRARSLTTLQVTAAITIAVLNRMIRTAELVPVRRTRRGTTERAGPSTRHPCDHVVN